MEATRSGRQDAGVNAISFYIHNNVAGRSKVTFAAVEAADADPVDRANRHGYIQDRIAAKTRKLTLWGCPALDRQSILVLCKS